MHATPSDKPVGGLAILGNELFVARKGNVQQIEVYDRSTLNFRHHLTVPGLGKIPYDLASCAINKCLYVINRCLVLDDVIRVGLSDDAGNGGGTTAVSKWPNVGFNAQGLFVRNSGNVLVTCYSSVVEFTTDGVVVREIVRQTGPMTFLYHCVQLNDDGPFVVCGGRQHRVSQLAIVGDGHCEVRCSYDGHCDITAGPLDEPGHMAIDRNGWIVVADRNNNRLVAMNPSLSCARQVPVVVDVDGGGLRGPWTVCFDESRNRLYVGERDAGRVLAFDYVNDVRFLRFAS